MLLDISSISQRHNDYSENLRKYSYLFKLKKKMKIEECDNGSCTWPFEGTELEVFPFACR